MKENTKPENNPTNIDIREQLFNEGRTGDIKLISLPKDQITQLNAIMVDLDLELIAADGLIPIGRNFSPAEVYEQYVKHWLERHPVLAKAEVRCSGKGLHVLLWLDKPIQFKDEIDRERWRARVMLIQRILPSDPRQPNIDAKTRVIGSINGKNGAVVERLRTGDKVTQEELLDLVDQMLDSRLSLIGNVLFGVQAAEQCPLCHQAALTRSSGSSVECYNCGKINTTRVFDAVFGTGKQDKEVGYAKA